MEKKPNGWHFFDPLTGTPYGLYMQRLLITGFWLTDITGTILQALFWSYCISVPLQFCLATSELRMATLRPTFQVNIYGVSTLATVEVHDEIQVISHFNTHTYSYYYMTKALFFLEPIWCKTLPSKERLSCIFCVKHNTVGNRPRARTHSPWLFPDHS